MSCHLIRLASTGYQSHFLAVPVDTSDTGLAGTSFAAPVITAYAALIAQKFTSGGNVSPTTVTDQLSHTAIMQTGWTADKYGVGEACLACALSPTTLQ